VKRIETTKQLRIQRNAERKRQKRRREAVLLIQRKARSFIAWNSLLRNIRKLKALELEEAEREKCITKVRAYIM
jgi:hypothetical protein